MRPERIEHRKGKGLVIVHRCTACGAALLIDVATGPAELPQAAPFLTGRRVA